MLEWKWSHLRRPRAGSAQGWHFCYLEESRSVYQHVSLLCSNGEELFLPRAESAIILFLSSQLKELYVRIIVLKLTSQQSQYLCG